MNNKKKIEKFIAIRGGNSNKTLEKGGMLFYIILPLLIGLPLLSVIIFYIYSKYYLKKTAIFD